jgi:DNA-binding NarL/FixJ family response regulator
MEIMQRSSAGTRPVPDISAGTAGPLAPRELPRAKSSVRPSGDEAHAAAGVLRVLLVEDSPLLVQRILELVAELPGVQIAGTAATEAEALARLETDDIDAVILDLQLHAGSGFGILRALGRQPSRPQVVVFTNFAIAAYRDTALALGASYFLDKSRDYERLPSVLQAMSETRH